MSRLRVGVDVGGTKIAAALVDATGTVHARACVPTPADRGGHAVLDAVERAVRAVAEDRELVAIGIGTGGVVDAGAGAILSATDLLPGWAGTEVAKALRTRLGVAVFVDNDVNALALGEQRFGAGARGTVLYAALGTGIGGALVIDGVLRHGPHHTAGGIGHLLVGGDRRCSCGQTGHLESVASGPAVTATYRERSSDKAVVELREVARRAQEGDQVAREVIAAAATTLGRALAGAANVLDPDLVVLGGGVANIQAPFLTTVHEAFAPELLPPLRTVEVRTASLGADASLIGAAAIAFDHNGA